MFIFILKAIFFFVIAVIAIQVLTLLSEKKIRNKRQTEKYLRQNLPADIQLLSEIFSENNYELYLVGGCIRDVFLRKNPKDYDLCTNALPETVMTILKKSQILCKEQGEHFGVIVAMINNQSYEIATFREDFSRNSDIESFISYIRETKPDNYEERIRILLDMSNNKKL